MPAFEYRCHIAFVTQHSVKLFNRHLGGNSFNLAANRAKGQTVKIASVYRTYTKGKTDGIDIAAQPGSAVVAAKTGSVAAITSDSDNVHVIVLRHADGLLTIYSNVTGIAVKEGQQVSQGAKIAEIRPGASPYVHFEVRRGMNSTDPMPFLE